MQHNFAIELHAHYLEQHQLLTELEPYAPCAKKTQQNYHLVPMKAGWWDPPISMKRGIALQMKLDLMFDIQDSTFN